MIVDRSVPELIQRLNRDHARIAAVIREFARESDALVRSEGPDWMRLEELIGFLQYYADAVHHPLEDRIFDRLLDKGLTPTERHVVMRNLAQHQEILGLTRSVAADIHTHRSGGIITEEEFSEKIDRYLGLQRRHMEFEDVHLFPLLESRFGNEDWNALQSIIGSSQEHHE